MEDRGRDPTPVIDTLIPPPWDTRRRWRVGLTAAGTVLLVAAAWWGGLLGPNLRPIQGAGWSTHGPVEVGSSGTVVIELPLTNRGWITVSDVAVLPPTLVGATVEALDVPDRLEPGEQGTVELALEVTDCDTFRAPDGELGLVVRARSGLVGRTATARYLVGIGGPRTWDEGDDTSSVWNVFAEPICDASWYEDASA